MSTEDKWLSYAKRIHALATCGLEFSKSHYELDRYEEIQSIATDMLAELSNSPRQNVKALMLHGVEGYVTPKTDVRAAVIKENKILLVQEKTDNLWALPGGYADVGLSPDENAVKEVWEEANIKVKATKLYAVRHKAKGEYKADLRDFYKLFFLCDQLTDDDVFAGSEVLDAQFFSLQSLPELSSGRTVESDLRAAFLHHNHRDKATYYDGCDFNLV